MQIVSTNLIYELIRRIRPRFLPSHTAYQISRRCFWFLTRTPPLITPEHVRVPNSESRLSIPIRTCAAPCEARERRDALSRARLARARRALGEDARRMGHPPPLASTCLREPLRESARMVCSCICAMCSVRVLNCLLGPLPVPRPFAFLHSPFAVVFLRVVTGHSTVQSTVLVHEYRF